MSVATALRAPMHDFARENWWAAEGPAEILLDNLANVWDLKPIKTDLNLGVYRGRSWLIDGILISQAESDATIARRNKWQAENCASLVYVHRYQRGASYGYAGNLLIEKAAGEVLLTDQEMQLELVQTPLFAQGLHIPKSVLGYDRKFHAPMINFSSNRLISQILHGEMDRLFDALVSSQDEARAILHRLIACLKVAIASPDQDGDVRRQARNALRDQIAQYIEANLNAPHLSVESLLQRFGVSRAGLYRMFEAKGGVRQFISDRKLYHAIAELTERPSERGRINAVADKWGFSTGANFNRAVKRRFGVPPGALLEPLTADRMPVQTYSKIHDFFG